jgi:hypothetical protein
MTPVVSNKIVKAKVVTASPVNKKLCNSKKTSTKSGKGKVPSSMKFSNPHLTPEVWALILSFLPYVDNLQCTAINRTFLHEVASKVTQITVLSSDEMKEEATRTLRRFPAITDVTIGCLLRERRIMQDGDRSGEHADEEEEGVVEETNFEADTKVVGLVVPFLSLFPALKLARVGGFSGRGSDGSTNEFLEYHDGRVRRSERDHAAMFALRTSVCGAYRFGALPSGASIKAHYGPCPFAPSTFFGDDNSYCALCAECIETFPIKDAIDSMQFSCSCLSEKTKLKILSNRPEGREFITNPSNFLLFHWNVINAMNELKLIPTVSRETILKLKAQGKLAEVYYGNILALESAGVPVDFDDYDRITVD